MSGARCRRLSINPSRFTTCTNQSLFTFTSNTQPPALPCVRVNQPFITSSPPPHNPQTEARPFCPQIRHRFHLFYLRSHFVYTGIESLQSLPRPDLKLEVFGNLKKSLAAAGWRDIELSLESQEGILTSHRRSPARPTSHRYIHHKQHRHAPNTPSSPPPLPQTSNGRI